MLGFWDFIWLLGCFLAYLGSLVVIEKHTRQKQQHSVSVAILSLLLSWVLFIIMVFSYMLMEE